MKKIFIPAKSKFKINYNLLEKLPKNIAIAYSIQYENQAKIIKQHLSKTHNITNFFQVLGCSKPVFNKNCQAILFIGDGKFHALNLGLVTNLSIYIIERDKIIKIPKSDIIQLKQKTKSSYINFLNSDRIGILISIKPGQQNLKKAISIKNKLKGKKSYLFIANNLNISEFENFPNIQSWINTACPRMDMNSNKIVNSDILIDFFKNSKKN